MSNYQVVKLVQIDCELHTGRNMVPVVEGEEAAHRRNDCGKCGKVTMKAAERRWHT